MAFSLIANVLKFNVMIGMLPCIYLCDLGIYLSLLTFFLHRPYTIFFQLTPGAAAYSGQPSPNKFPGK